MSFMRTGDSDRDTPTLTIVEGPNLLKVVGDDLGLSEEERTLRARLSQLRQEHRDLDAAIDADRAAHGKKPLKPWYCANCYYKRLLKSI